MPAALEYIALTVLAVVMVPLGLWVFTRTERRLRRLGTIGEY
jgi:hypothetical protein